MPANAEDQKTVVTASAATTRKSKPFTPPFYNRPRRIR
jgi:hypothetical protein